MSRDPHARMGQVYGVDWLIGENIRVQHHRRFSSQASDLSRGSSFGMGGVDVGYGYQVVEERVGDQAVLHAYASRPVPSQHAPYGVHRVVGHSGMVQHHRRVTPSHVRVGSVNVPQPRPTAVAPITEADEALMRRAIELAASARENGNHPFGALLADIEGNIILEAENTVVSDTDCTAHAELNLIRKASKELTSEERSAATLFTSTEPCAMCCGAIYWSGITQVVYGLPEDGLDEFIGDSMEKLATPSRTIFNNGRRHVKVRGPVLREEATRVHENFWDQLV